MAGVDSGRSKQIIQNFFLKFLQSVLDSRVPHLLNGNRIGGDKSKKRDRWFNLALGDYPSILENPQFSSRNLAETLILDVLLIKDSNFNDSIIEKWTVQYQPISDFDNDHDQRRFYKQCVILLRSIVSVLRFLPAFKAFSMLRSCSTKNCNFNLSYRVSSFAGDGEFGLLRYEFPAVEAGFGRLAVSVDYRADLDEYKLESSSLIPPAIITDYVGSPQAAALVSRPHSWACTPLIHNQVSNLASPGRRQWGPAEYSMSPPFSPSPRLETETAPVRIPVKGVHGNGGLLRSFTNWSDLVQMSPTTSPMLRAETAPVRIPVKGMDGNAGQFGSFRTSPRLQAETAPVRIPVKGLGGNAGQFRSAENCSEPGRVCLPPQSPSRKGARGENSSGESPEIRSFRRVEGFQLGSAPKGLRDPRDDSGRFSGVLSSCGGSPRVGFSRSSSKLSFQDDLDDSCPFAFDDVDVPESQRRATDGRGGPENPMTSSSPSTWTSQEAAVGILVRMLRTAPPLRQDLGHSFQPYTDPCIDERVDRSVDGGLGTSSFYSTRRAGDAMEELRGYKQIKDMLLSKSGSYSIGKNSD